MEINEEYLKDSEEQTTHLIEKHREHIVNPQNLTTFKKTVFVMDEGSKIKMEGELVLGKGTFDDYGRSTILRMDRNSKFIVQSGGKFEVFYGGDIAIFSNCTLTVGAGSFINSNCMIRCAKNITIGPRCAISHNVTIIDSDFHVFIEEDGEEKSPYGKKGIVIGAHVWIGTGAKILKDVTIGHDSVIAAGAVVTKDVPPHTLVGGMPAKVLKTNISWRIRPQKKKEI